MRGDSFIIMTTKKYNESAASRGIAKIGGMKPMLGKCFGAICLVSVAFACISGNLDALSNAVIDGASRAVEVTFSLLGMMCLWCGVMRALSDAGLIRGLARLLAPLMRLIFPHAVKTGEGIEEITASLAANILGVGKRRRRIADAENVRCQ